MNFTKITSYSWNFQNFTRVLTILVKFDIHFLGIPWAILKASIIINATCIGFCSLVILFCFEFMLWVRKHKRIGREINSEIFSFKNPLVDPLYKIIRIKCSFNWSCINYGEMHCDSVDSSLVFFYKCESSDWSAYSLPWQ